MPKSKNTICPYPGLRSFNTSESRLFFGRDNAIKQVNDLLDKNRFLAILGASGTGKSSLVRCGILAKYFHQSESSWKIIEFSPGSNPTFQLAAAFHPIIAPSNENINDLYDHLKENSDYLSKILSKQKAQKLLIYIDRFEDVFIEQEIGQKKENIDHFINSILCVHYLNNNNIKIIMSMRSDFSGHISDYPQFTDVINRGTYMVPKMTIEEKKEAIIKPVHAKGQSITAELTDRLIKDLHGQNELPVMQHALMRTWNYWLPNSESSRPIDSYDYQHIGTVEYALSRHVEEAYAELDSNRKQYICEKTFQALTSNREGENKVQRPTTLSEICHITDSSIEEVEDIVDKFRSPECSFLLPNTVTKLAGETIIQISNECLMHLWPRLIDWMEDESQSASIYMRLAKSAAFYQEGYSDLWRTPQLQLALNWREVNRPNKYWASRYDHTYERAMSFLTNSEKKHEYEVQLKELKQKKRIRRTRIAAILASFASLVFLTLAVYAMYETTEATKHKANAEIEKKKALEQENIAIKNAEKAFVNEQDAIKQKEIASEQASIAKEQRLEAINQRVAADSLRAKAEVISSLEELKRIEAEMKEQLALGEIKVAEEQMVVLEKEKQFESQKRNEAEEVARKAELQGLELRSENNLILANNKALSALILIKEKRADQAVGLIRQSYDLFVQGNTSPQNEPLFNAFQGLLNRAGRQPVIAQLNKTPKILSLNQENINEFCLVNNKREFEYFSTVNKIASQVYRKVLKNDKLSFVTFLPRTNLIAAGTVKGKVFILEKKQEVNNKFKIINEFNYDSSIKKLVTLSQGKTTHMFILSGNKLDKLVLLGQNMQNVSFRSFTGINDIITSEQAAHLIFSIQKNIFIYQLDNNKLNLKSTLSGNIKSSKIALSKNQNYLASSDDKGHLTLYHLNKELIAIDQKEIKISDDPCQELTFNSNTDSKQLSYLGKKGTLKLIDIDRVFKDKINNDDLLTVITLENKFSHAFFIPGKDELLTIDQEKKVKIIFTSVANMNNMIAPN